jgi:hypothetical protein
MTEREDMGVFLALFVQFPGGFFGPAIGYVYAFGLSYFLCVVGRGTGAATGNDLRRDSAFHRGFAFYVD